MYVCMYLFLNKINFTLSCLTSHLVGNYYLYLILFIFFHSYPQAPLGYNSMFSTLSSTRWSVVQAFDYRYRSTADVWLWIRCFSSISSWHSCFAVFQWSCIDRLYLISSADHCWCIGSSNYHPSYWSLLSPFVWYNPCRSHSIFWFDLYCSSMPDIHKPICFVQASWASWP